MSLVLISAVNLRRVRLLEVCGLPEYVLKHAAKSGGSLALPHKMFPGTAIPRSVTLCTCSSPDCAIFSIIGVLNNARGKDP